MKSTAVLILLCFIAFTLSVKAQEISVFTGFWGPEYYQDDKQITRVEAKKLLLDYEKSEPYWKKSATNEALFYGTYVVSLGSAFWLGSELGKDRNDRELGAPTAVTLGGLLVSIIFMNGANKNAKKAILTYNKQFDDKETSFRLVPIGSKNGVGLALKF